MFSFVPIQERRKAQHTGVRCAHATRWMFAPRERERERETRNKHVPRGKLLVGQWGSGAIFEQVWVMSLNFTLAPTSSTIHLLQLFPLKYAANVPLMWAPMAAGALANSPFAIVLRWTMSGPSATRSVRTCVYLGDQGNRCNVSHQGPTNPCIMHHVYYVQDRDSRSQLYIAKDVRTCRRASSPG